MQVKRIEDGELRAVADVLPGMVFTFGGDPYVRVARPCTSDVADEFVGVNLHTGGEKAFDGSVTVTYHKDAFIALRRDAE